MTATAHKRAHATAALSALLALVILALLIGGCADVYYADTGGGNRGAEARYNTYYAPHYYPYYPWYSYYGGAYYYSE